MKAIKPRSAAVLGLTLLLGMGVPVNGQVRPLHADAQVPPVQARRASDLARDRRAPAREYGLQTLIHRLRLNERQTRAVRAAMRDDERGDAGVWRLSRVLQDVLTPEQKERLFNQGMRAASFARGVRWAESNRADRRDRGQRALRNAERQNRLSGNRETRLDRPAGVRGTDRERAALMADALGLTASQRELLRIHRALVVGMKMARQSGRR